MGRLAIYINDELEKQMEGYRDHINWSRVAQEAFEKAIRIEELKGTGNVEAASLERLRASRENVGVKRVTFAHAAGKDWAMQSAEYDDLERVSALEVNLFESGDTVRENFVIAWWGNTDPDWEIAHEFLERHFDTASPTVDQIEGFVAGAREVFEQV